ncbi:MAG: DUF4317 domain-containing protein [Firmicutes bacterium]|nr:DUF4317 domain-containing protein [Bacillota bacterium]
MNLSEVKEIRRRFKLDKDSISHIYGCYVNAAKEIVTTIDMPVGLMEQEEAEMYLKILKKSLSGTLGRNLIEIPFSTAQVENSEEHRLLQAIRHSQLREAGLRDALYQRIIETLNLGDESYVILLGYDAYDVPFKTSNDEFFDDGSAEVFDYFVCAVCPVKDAKSALRYTSEEKTFRSTSTGHIMSPPTVGFMFPAFDNRSANIYSAMYYSKDLMDLHDELIQGFFNIENVPMSAGLQKNTFSMVLSDTLEGECSLEVVQAVHGEIREKLELHKESKDVEVPEIYVEDVGDILKKNGVSEEKITAFHQSCEAQFGNAGVLNPSNLMETKSFELNTADVKIKVAPDCAESIRTKVIDGIKYILIPVGEGVEVNGIDIDIKGE